MSMILMGCSKSDLNKTRPTETVNVESVGIKIEVSVPQSTFKVEEDINISLKITNLREKDVNFQGPTRSNYLPILKIFNLNGELISSSVRDIRGDYLADREEHYVLKHNQTKEYNIPYSLVHRDQMIIPNRPYWFVIEPLIKINTGHLDGNGDDLYKDLQYYGLNIPPIKIIISD